MSRNCLEINIRVAREDDSEIIDTMIKELAEYEKCLERVVINRQTISKYGFGKNALFTCLLAEVLNKDTDIHTVVGYLMYYKKFSPFYGPGLVLEDVYVKQEYRNQNIGSMLLRKLTQVALDEQLNHIDFVCLDWNKSSLVFYERTGARNITNTEHWNLLRYDEEAINRIASGVLRKN